MNGNSYENPVFFFIYNFDNYYHFLYDTLPYLYTYLYLKKKIPNIKLLINYPNKFKKEFYRFNKEFLEKIVNINNDLLIHEENNIYSKIYISSSLTHGGYSNNPPRSEIYKIYDIIKSKVKLEITTPEYIYISRRTWINNDSTNIGTDYTNRRKMMNEHLLVEELIKLGFKEVFAENLSTDEKIKYFSNAKIIIGSIGGGMANLLFSNNNTKSIVLVTPYFLNINYRFKFSMESSDIIYFDDIITYKENNKIPLYCRARICDNKSKYYNKIGEIIEYNNKTNKYKMNISNNDVAGFNNLVNYDNDYFDESELKLLDNGLNSPYIVNIKKLLVIINNIL
jgi:capsular polysaccharide biosynthesis protein